MLNKKLSEEEQNKLHIYPSILAAYNKEKAELIGELLPHSNASLKKSDGTLIDQEIANNILDANQNGALGEFYGQYLYHTMSEAEHKEALNLAKFIMDKGLKEGLERKVSLAVKIFAIDLADTALVYGHRMFKTACVLESSQDLPQDLKFIFWSKKNPAFYEEMERFQKCETLLAPYMKKIPNSYKQAAFDQWLYKTGEAQYVAGWMQTAATAEFISNTYQPDILKLAIRSLEIQEKREKNRPIHKNPRRLYRESRFRYY